MQVNVATSGRWSPTGVDVGVPPGIAKERGVRLGRPPKLNAHQRQEALARREAGETLMDIARSYSVGHPNDYVAVVRHPLSDDMPVMLAEGPLRALSTLLPFSFLSLACCCTGISSNRRKTDPIS